MATILEEEELTHCIALSDIDGYIPGFIIKEVNSSSTLENNVVVG